VQDASKDNRPAPAGRLPRDFLVGLAVLLFCALVYWLSLGIKAAPAALAQNVQPATFPRMLLAVIAGLVLLMMARSFRSDSQPKKAVKPMVAMTGAMTIGFTIAFDALGILPAMVLFCASMPVVWGERRWLPIAAYAVLFPAAVYALFALALGVYFEPGLLAYF